MRKFLSHKTVQAAKILSHEDADFGGDKGAGLNMVLEGQQHFVVPPASMLPFQRMFERDDGDVGYLIQYTDGYLSWSPTDVFESGYAPIEGETNFAPIPADGVSMSFGMAIEALRKGAKVAREGWADHGMWLVLVGGTPSIDVVEGTIYHRAGLDEVEINPHIDMMTATGQMQPGWLASQTDMLANDWCIVD